MEHPCGGRQVSGCARFTLAFANGDTSRSKGESESLLSSGWKEERGRAERRAREKRGASGGEGGFAPKKRVTRHVIPALPLLFVAPGARTRYPGPGPVREDIYRGVQDASTPTYDGPSNDILLARLVTPHLPTRCLSLPFLLLPACRPPCFFLPFFLALRTRCLGPRFLVGGSQPAATSATAEQSPRSRRS